MVGATHTALLVKDVKAVMATAIKVIRNVGKFHPMDLAEGPKGLSVKAANMVY